MKRQLVATAILLGLSALLYVVLGYTTPRTDFTQLLLLYTLCFAAYGYIINQRFSVWAGIGAAIFFRLLLLVATPALSDDFFRFIWDGRLLAAGINPYLHLPSFFMTDAAPELAGINEALFQQLNSPDYYSVYPPVTQYLLWLSASLSPDSLKGSIILIRLIIILAEIGSILVLLRLLRKIGLPDRNVLLYALNPLVILELTGNLHLEALMIFFILLSIYQIFYLRTFLAGSLFGLAIGAKLLPLLFLPFIWRRLGTGQFALFLAAVFITLGIVCFPLLSLEVVSNMAQSINLYFQRFEFNASFYYLLRWLGFRFTGYNQIAVIGPILSVATFVLTIALATTKKLGSTKRMLGFMAAALTIFLFLATTVHPWYLTTLVALTAASHFRFAVIWSGLAVLSYAAYHSSPYSEDLALVALEYVIVISWLVVELYLYRQRIRQANLS